jgi:hypothetical protein
VERSQAKCGERVTDPSSGAGGRGRVWLRALLLSPLVLIALGAIAGERGHTAIPFDTLSGGGAPGKLTLFMLLGHAGIALFAFSALAIYGALIGGGSRAVSSRRIAMSVSAAALIGGYGLFLTVDGYVQREIREAARAGLATEQIANERWRATGCGRGRYVCIDWEGSLGRGRVKGYVGGRPIGDELTQWRDAHSADTPLVVEWGRTPSGWIAVKTARAGNLRLANRWP